MLVYSSDSRNGSGGGKTANVSFWVDLSAAMELLSCLRRDTWCSLSERRARAERVSRGKRNLCSCCFCYYYHLLVKAFILFIEKLGHT